MKEAQIVNTASVQDDYESNVDMIFGLTGPQILRHMQQSAKSGLVGPTDLAPSR